MNRETFYNVIFPVWLLLLFPPLIFATIIGNFIVDSLVILFCIWLLKISDKSVYRKVIWKVWIFGFLADILGSLLLLGGAYLFDFNSFLYEHLVNPLYLNPSDSFLSLAFCLFTIVVSGLCIYFFNKKYSFEKTNLKEYEKKKIAFLLAIITAPYMFLIPLEPFLDQNPPLEIASPVSECVNGESSNC